MDALTPDSGIEYAVPCGKRSLGRLKLRSGTLVLGDPLDLPGLEVSNVATDEIEMVASLWRYPSGVETVGALSLVLGKLTRAGTHRKVGEVAIDTAKLVVADKVDIEKHWTAAGKDRIGVIITADTALLPLLTKQFKLKIVRVNPGRVELVDPVSAELAAEILAFLKTVPKYADDPSWYFRVQTNNSFERVNYMKEGWEFMPVGNDPDPMMFACGTGDGDGCFDVKGQFDGDVPRVLTVTFIES